MQRRQFLKLSAAGGVLLLTTIVGGKRTVRAQIAGGTLGPGAIAKFTDPMVIPPVMPRKSRIRHQGRWVDYYEISMKQFTQQILPAGMPRTTVWGYGSYRSAATYNAPSFTIEATHGVPVRVTWCNELVDGNGFYRPHLLPVDQTLHWANPSGGSAGRDTRPTFAATPRPYTGPVPIVTHVHGMEGVGDESDGYAEAWYLPFAKNIPSSFAKSGTWYDYFQGKAKSKGYLAPNKYAWDPGTATFQYPNSQRASTVWYHDHALGMTRLNVYAGPAGFYIIRGGAAGDGAVLDKRSSTAAVLPGPAPRAGDPAGTRYYEIPIAIQDRSFNSNGSLFYPDTRAFFDGITGPYIPTSDIAPIWNPEFFGNVMMVNGKTWPYQTVEQRRYRFRFLNGCDSRFLILDFAQIPGAKVWMIGNEGGFLAEPANITGDAGNQLLMGPAERADVIVDFTNVPVGTYLLTNVGPDEPFGGGVPGVDFSPADPQSTGQVLQFRVVPIVGADPSTPPEHLSLPAISFHSGGTPRRLALLEKMSMFPGFDGPAETLLGRVGADGNLVTNPGMDHPGDMWMDPVTENPNVGDTEIWEFYNFTADAHPMHIHEVFFELVNRQDLVLDPAGEPAQPVELAGSTRGPEVWENGWKDTVIAYPGQVTRVRAKFSTPGQFVWHCHIVEHEDNEMMRPYRIGPADPKAPAPPMAARQFKVTAAGQASPFLCQVEI